MKALDQRNNDDLSFFPCWRPQVSSTDRFTRRLGWFHVWIKGCSNNSPGRIHTTPVSDTMTGLTGPDHCGKSRGCTWFLDGRPGDVFRITWTPQISRASLLKSRKTSDLPIWSLFVFDQMARVIGRGCGWPS